ncbi:MAG: hypothetical protein K940chlam9_01558 [Chlamydiae bacterium]|nr:hypothetical protein [Chlamydiota bacterium]
MPINRKIALALSLAAFLFFSPRFPLLYFAPYLVVCFYQLSFTHTLFRSLGCGVLVDLFSSNPHFGLHSLVYFLVSAALYHQKQNFFADKLSTVPIMTTFFSLLSTLLFLVARFFSSSPLHLSWRGVMTEFFALPLLEGTYALLVFSLPFCLIHFIRKMKIFRRRS